MRKLRLNEMLVSNGSPHSKPLLLLLLLLFLVGLEFELRASCLQSRWSIAWVTPPVQKPRLLIATHGLFLGWHATVRLCSTLSYSYTFFMGHTT
jgi:hypothetical protein